jgi:hypothetical protein
MNKKNQNKYLESRTKDEQEIQKKYSESRTRDRIPMSTHARKTKFIAHLRTMDLKIPEDQLQPGATLESYVHLG